jgi:hypothetical protein
MEAAAGRSGTFASDLTRVVDRPAKFSGGEYSAKAFNDWVLKVTQFVELLNVAPDQRVKVAASYLEGDALAWWARQKQKLLSDGTDVLDMEVFTNALRDRFSFRNPELQARAALRSCKQNNMTVASYINKFDDCYSYLEKWDEDDKIDRFLAGLDQKWLRLAAVNPQTSRRWTDYCSMINHLVTCLSEYPAELQAKDMAELSLKTKPGGGSDGAGPSNGQKPKWVKSSWQKRKEGARKASERSPVKLFTNDKRRNMENAAGQRYWRTAGQMAYIIQKKKDMCSCCFGTDHNLAAECRNSPKFAPPPGYNEFVAQLRRGSGTN